jgi:hypothetical protein
VVIELWAVKAFCLTPVIACVFFVASVLSMLEMQVSHLVSVPPGFPGPSYWHILEQSLKAVVLKHLLVLDHSG